VNFTVHNRKTFNLLHALVLILCEQERLRVSLKLSLQMAGSLKLSVI